MAQKNIDPKGSEIQELKEVLLSFVTEQKAFNEEQRIFNTKVDAKITDMDAKITDMDAKITDMDAKITDMDIKITDMDAKITDMDIKITDMDKKIDKVQYFLEESLAQNTKIFLEEQLEMKVEIKELEDEIAHMKNDMILFASQLNMLLAR